MIKAIIFDLDGTLLDTLEDLADSLNTVLQDMKLPTHPVEAYRYFVGNGAAKLVSRALPDEENNAKVKEDCLQRFIDVYKKNWNNKTKPYPGVTQLLDNLTAQQIKIAVLTNKPQDFAEICVKEFLPNWEFDAILGQREGIPMKPDPAGPREIVQNFNLNPENFLYLGDSNVDMKTANSAGIFAVGATWGFRFEQELLESGADAIVDHPTKLLNLLK